MIDRLNDDSYAHRIVGSPGGKHYKSLQRNVWCGAVSPLKTVRLSVKFMFTEFTQ